MEMDSNHFQSTPSTTDRMDSNHHQTAYPQRDHPQITVSKKYENHFQSTPTTTDKVHSNYPQRAIPMDSTWAVIPFALRRGQIGAVNAKRHSTAFLAKLPILSVRQKGL